MATLMLVAAMASVHGMCRAYAAGAGKVSADPSRGFQGLARSGAIAGRMRCPRLNGCRRTQHNDLIRIKVYTPGRVHMAALSMCKQWKR